MTKGACSKKKIALYVNHLSFLGVMWKYARQCKESQACCWYGKVLTPDRAAVPLSICPSETQRKREGWEQREGWVDRQRTKEGWKDRECDARREKMERGASKQTIGGRQVPGGYAGDGRVRRRRARKMDEADPCWVSVSDSRLGLLCAPVSTVGDTEDYSSSLSHILSYSSTFLLHFLYFLFHINMLTRNPYTYTHPCFPPILPTPLPHFLSPSLSLIRGHFHFKAPPLSAISEGN